MPLESLHYEFCCYYRINLFKKKKPKTFVSPITLEGLKKMQATLELVSAKTVLTQSIILATPLCFLDSFLSPWISFLNYPPSREESHSHVNCVLRCVLRVLFNSQKGFFQNHDSETEEGLMGIFSLQGQVMEI